MKRKLICQVAVAAGFACSASFASAQNVAPEVTVPLNGGTYSSGQVVYDESGAYSTAYGGEFVPPARFPVERIPVQYLRYYPQRWYGLPGSTLPAIAPQVYMPTDTTQLGFYYQRVPTWMPVPGMIPGPPNPTDYHTYLPMSYSDGINGSGVVTSDGTTVNGETIVSERVISSQPVGTASSAPTHSASGTISGDITVPPAPSGDALPLQPRPSN